MAGTGATKEEMAQAKELITAAQKQLDAMGKVIPEGKETLNKYPGLNPIGYHSEIDMGFAERMKRCESSVRLRDPLALEEYYHLKKQIESSPAFAEMKKEMINISKRIRSVDRALRICQDDKVRKILETEREKLQNKPALQDYGMAVRALECYSGIDAMNERNKHPDQKIKENREVVLFCEKKLGFKTGGDLYYDPFSRAWGFSNPKQLEIEFEDLDDIMQAHRMVSDKAMGKSWEEVENSSLEREDFAQHAPAIPAYMRASCDRLLDNALPNVKDRADFIFINGVSVREQMKTAEGIENPTEEQIKKFSSLYVAAALRKGIYVETFVRDYGGTNKNKINYNPIPITVKGEDSYVTKKIGENEMENITIGFFDRFLAKLGFTYFQKKLEKASAVERIKEARKGFRLANDADLKYGLGKEGIEERKKAFAMVHKYKDRFFQIRQRSLVFSGSQRELDGQFFPQGKKDVLNKATGVVVANDREKMRTFAIVEMLNAGYTLKEVLDTSKNADVRTKMAASVANKLENADPKTFYQMHLDASNTLQKALNDYAKENHISFKNPESVYKEAGLLDLATGVGNIIDIFIDYRFNKPIKKFFGDDIVQKVDEATRGTIVLGMVPKAASRLSGLYTKMAEGYLPGPEDVVEVVNNEVLETVFAKMEKYSNTPFSHPIMMEEMMSIQQMVLAHPSVEKLVKTSAPEKLAELLTQGKILETLGVDFEVLPEKVVPGRAIQSESFLIDIDPDVFTPTNVVPTFKGKSDFYEFPDPEKSMDDDFSM